MPTLRSAEYLKALEIKRALKALELHLAAGTDTVAKNKAQVLHQLLSEGATMPNVAALIGDVTPFSGGGNKPDDD
jgi:hypothetical protein